jgi:hypothetical protein
MCVWVYLGAKWKLVVNATPRPLYPRERPVTHCIGGWMGPRAGMDGCGKSRPTGIRFPDRPARSESLYRLSYQKCRGLRPGNLNCPCGLPRPLHRLGMQCSDTFSLHRENWDMIWMTWLRGLWERNRGNYVKDVSNTHLRQSLIVVSFWQETGSKHPNRIRYYASLWGVLHLSALTRRERIDWVSVVTWDVHWLWRGLLFADSQAETASNVPMRNRYEDLIYIFVWPCIVETSNIDNQLDATVMVY